MHCFYYLDIIYCKHALFTRRIGSPNFSDSWAVIPSVLSNYIKTILKQLGNYLGPIQSTNADERGIDRAVLSGTERKLEIRELTFSQKSIAYVRTSRWWRRAGATSK